VDGLEALEAAIDDADEPVIYLRGRGPAFSAGADLNEVAALEGDRDRAADFARLGQRVARTIEDAPAVVVAGIDGPARGGGLELALPVTFVWARPSRPTANRGSASAVRRLGRDRQVAPVLGEGDALEFALSGRSIDAEEALRIGLISRIDDDPRSVAEEIATNETDALVALKRRIRDDGERATQERREAAAFADLVAAHADDIDALLE